MIAVAMTSQEPRAGFPLTIESKAIGLQKRSWIKISQIERCPSSVSASDSRGPRRRKSPVSSTA